MIPPRSEMAARVAGVEVSTEHWIGGKRVASRALRGPLADR
jgi:hypothetical protein